MKRKILESQTYSILNNNHLIYNTVLEKGRGGSIWRHPNKYNVHKEKNKKQDEDENEWNLILAVNLNKQKRK